ncbi:hypothetical protein LLS1_24370 [Leifsonia sp. LS1]|uniref:hypothetical protein n=1 Tax=Leifsonia sp. LS1 TaxID=2828483 RepID=UPI001CFC6D30|nr:hypothetical protein [Leifsonia sp. LS1]GIT80768.1 hypothetical protein LLS1_24370 [Leifsonia sp. LS1]
MKKSTIAVMTAGAAVALGVLVPVAGYAATQGAARPASSSVPAVGGVTGESTPSGVSSTPSADIGSGASADPADASTARIGVESPGR